MNDLATRQPDALATTGQGERKNPLRLLPDEWRQPVGFFYSFHSDLLKGSMGVVTRMRMWMKDDGLTLDEATAAMKRAMKPEACSQFGYAGQLLAYLAGEVAAVVKVRREREAVIERRKSAEDAQKNAAPPAAWEEARNRLGVM